MKNSITEQLNIIELLKNEGKLEKALQCIIELEIKSDIEKKSRISLWILKTQILCDTRQYIKASKLTEKIINSVITAGTKFNHFDLLIVKSTIECFSDLDEALLIVDEATKIYDTFPHNKSPETLKRKADLDYIKSKILFHIGETEHSLLLSQNSLDLFRKFKLKFKEAQNLLLLGLIYSGKYDYDQGLGFSNQSLILREKIGIKADIVESLWFISSLYIHKGELDKALNLSRQCLTVKEIRDQIKAEVLMNLGEIYFLKGEINQSMDFFKNCLILAEKNNSKEQIIDVLICMGLIHRVKGEIEKALELIDRSVTISEKNGFSINYVVGLYLLINCKLDQGKMEESKILLKKMEEMKRKKSSDIIDMQYTVSRAIILKASGNFQDRIESEKIYRSIIETEHTNYNLKTVAITELCHLLLSKINNAQETKTLEEIESLINHLLATCKFQNSFSGLAETYLLQAKLSLIQFNISKAREFLTLAQKIANNHNLHLLAQKISAEHDKVLEETEFWDGMRQKNISLSERVKLTSFMNTIDHIRKKNVFESEIIEIEEPINLLIMNIEGSLLYSHSFTPKLEFDENLISGFMSVVNIFRDQIFSESLDRVKLNQNIALFESLGDFFLCYLFRGQSYIAKQKLSFFSELIKNDKQIFEILERVTLTGTELDEIEINRIENLINETFLVNQESTGEPIKAYEGSNPFLFASYSHLDQFQVYPVLDYLNKTGINIWYDKGIPGGEKWRDKVTEKMNKCSGFIVFVSPYIANSDYVRKEIYFSIKKKKKCYAIYLKDTQLPDSIAFEMEEIQSIKKYLISEAEFYNRLRNDLSPLLH